MPDIFSDLPIHASIERVFDAVSTPAGLDTWWTKTCTGAPVEGGEFSLGFGPGYDWRARVTQRRPSTDFELQLIDADPDWMGTRVRFQLEASGESTQLRFSHIGWPTANEHWRISCYCWPIYLRLLRRSLEYGEVVPYDERLSV
ncbi:MAG TPA: SRPBCC domain-containing protein [Gemmatimonadaceae bacterium]|nr:SRPBCC domain-containing protein [Gemmatimonadaceae bacterium]